MEIDAFLLQVSILILTIFCQSSIQQSRTVFYPSDDVKIRHPNLTFDKPMEPNLGLNLDLDEDLLEPDIPANFWPTLPDSLEDYKSIPKSVLDKGTRYPHFLRWGAWLVIGSVENARVYLNGLRMTEEAERMNREEPQLDMCYIDIAKIKGPEPIFLDMSRNLLIPSDGFYRFYVADNFLVDCGNGHVGSKQIECYGTVENDRNWFLVDSHLVKSNVFTTCRPGNTLIPTVDTTGNCIGSSVHKDVGLSGEYGFHKLYEVCYNENDLNPLYTVHTIYGQSIYRPMPNSNRGRFEAFGMPNGLTREKLDAVYAGSGYQKGHLSPWNDQIFQNFRIATNLYINVVPQLASNNVGNWKQLESLVHAIAGAMHDNLVVIQGTYTKLNQGPVTHLSHTDANSVTTNLPIPQYLWKLVKIHSNKEILFVTLNKKELTVPEGWDIGLFCTNWCGLLNLHEFYNENSGRSSNPRNGNNGVVVCCSVDQVLQRYPDFPLPRHLVSPHGSHWAHESTSLKK